MRTFLCCSVLMLGLAFGVGAKPLIFPEPQSVETLADAFLLDEQVSIAVPEKASTNDLFLARFLAAELSDRYRLGLRTIRVSAVPRGRRIILMGSVSNPLVGAYCAAHHIDLSALRPGPEGYVIETGRDVVLVAGSDERGAFYGLQSLRQLLVRQDEAVFIRSVRVRDWPYKPFRALKLYLPGRANIPFFKRFVRDFLALYKYNYVMVEMNAGMRLERRPELNAGWIELFKELLYSRRDRPTGPHQQFQDSPNQDAADGGVLEKEEVAELVRWCREHYVEVIPEVPSLTHSYYLLTRHRELAEIRDAEWPDTYCPSNPKSYELLFDVLDEYIDVVKPKWVNAGHDEWRMPVDVCPLCRGKDPRELFARDVNKIYDHLKQRGVRMAIWGDHLVEGLRGKRVQKHVTSTGYVYYTPGGLSPEQVKRLIPKDILILNWFWMQGTQEEGAEGSGEEYEASLAGWGFQQAYGNFTPGMKDYGKRSSRTGIIGGAPSAWVATTEFNFGKDLVNDFASCASLLWSKRWPEPAELSRWVAEVMPEIRRNFSGQTPPSEEGDPVFTVKLEPNLRPGGELAGFSPAALKNGKLSSGPRTFELAGGVLAALARAGDAKTALHGEPAVRIGEDPSSLLFLHACARPAGNEPGYRTIFNFPDTADLLGWYEVVYEDGLIEAIPIRYGVNILEWNHGDGRGSADNCYLADPLACGRERPVSFYAFEWTNPRLGKVVKEIRLKVSQGFKNSDAKVIPENPLFVAAVSYVKRRAYPSPVGARGWKQR